MQTERSTEVSYAEVQIPNDLYEKWFDVLEQFEELGDIDDAITSLFVELFKCDAVTCRQVRGSQMYN